MQNAWHNFWFKDIDARQYAALRIVFGCISATYFAGLLPYAETQFSGQGWLLDHGQIANQNGGSWSLFFIQTDSYANRVAFLLFSSGIVSSLLMAFGWHSRLMACLTWLAWVSAWNRNPLILDGDDAVLKIMCFYLMLSPCGLAWSIDVGRHKKPGSVPVWPLRLVQFQIALIYFVSGWVKFHSEEWADGSIIQYIVIHPHYSRWDGWAVIGLPFVKELMAGLAWFIRAWELMFPLLLLNPYTRGLNIVIGLMFHLGLLFTMNLRGFAVVMPSLYLALVPTSFFQNLETSLIKRLQSIQIWRNNP